jgi:DNA-binding HxlR family transcriptional regulator
MVCVTLSESREQPHDMESCTGALVRALTFLGKRWNGLILANLTLSPAGFADLRRRVGTITDSVLSDRLTELADVGMVKRVVVPDTRPPTVRYELTGAGLALAPAFEQLTKWAAVNLKPEDCAKRG